MIFAKPTKHQVTRIGFSDSYHLDSDELTFVIETVAGGWRAFNPTEEDGLVFILQGIGSAKLKKELEYDINGEALIDIPAHSFFKLEQGQYRYIYTKGLTSYSIEENKENTLYQASDKQRLVYVLDGAGSTEIDGQKHPLREGYLLELPKETDVEIKGNFKYILING